MMTIGERSTVPTGEKTRAACGKQIEIRARAGKRLAVTAALGVGPPENHTDIQTSFDRAVQDIEDRAASVRHLENRGNEGERDPDSVLGLLHRFTNPAESGTTVNQGREKIPSPPRIGSVRDERNVLPGFSGCRRVMLIHQALLVRAVGDVGNG